MVIRCGCDYRQSVVDEHAKCIYIQAFLLLTHWRRHSVHLRFSVTLSGKNDHPCIKTKHWDSVLRVESLMSTLTVTFPI